MSHDSLKSIYEIRIGTELMVARGIGGKDDPRNYEGVADAVDFGEAGCGFTSDKPEEICSNRKCLNNRTKMPMSISGPMSSVAAIRILGF
jgi:hypothetical protein